MLYFIALHYQESGCYGNSSNQMVKSMQWMQSLVRWIS